MLKYHQTQSRNQEMTVPASLGDMPTEGQVQISINGNNNYKQLVGVMLLITDKEGNPFTKRAMVSISTTSGMLILPEQPYACFRPSFAEKPLDRIIPVDNVAGFGHDIRFQVKIENQGLEEVRYHVTAVCYFTNK